jgi:uncharacterized protein YbcC (UPF0753/DUF2309 family)
MLAKIANIPEVRQALKENHNIGIPASTIFIEENTIPLQMILLFDSDSRLKTNCKVEIKFAKKHNKRQLKKGWPLPIIVLLLLIKKYN